MEMDSFQNETDVVNMRWEHFQSDIGLKFYFVGVSTDSMVADLDCGSVVKLSFNFVVVSSLSVLAGVRCLSFGRH